RESRTQPHYLLDARTGPNPATVSWDGQTDQGDFIGERASFGKTQGSIKPLAPHHALEYTRPGTVPVLFRAPQAKELLPDSKSVHHPLFTGLRIPHVPCGFPDSARKDTRRGISARSRLIPAGFRSHPDVRHGGWEHSCRGGGALGRSRLGRRRKGREAGSRQSSGGADRPGPEVS